MAAPLMAADNELQTPETGTPQTGCVGRDPSVARIGASTGQRVVLYSHDAVGLGHLRRNLRIARALANSPLQPSVLVVTGVGEARRLPRVPRVDYLTLPSLLKRPGGGYGPRFLEVESTEMTAVRSATLEAAIGAFDPDLLIVDKVPRGIQRELDPTLELLRDRHTRIVLGLRDFLDDPEVVRSEWALQGNDEAIERYYDAIWVYGDRRVHDVAKAYDLAPNVVEKLEYTGYFDHRAPFESERPTVPEFGALRLDGERLAVCMVGGGEDGAHLAKTFAHARFPRDTRGVILTGPFMPSELRRDLEDEARSSRGQLAVLDFLPEPMELLERADRVVSMGGYNTLLEVIALQKPALVVPRCTPRREQLLRAERFSELGLVDVCYPEDLSPSTLSAWLSKPAVPPVHVRDRIDLDGLARVPGMVQALTDPSADKGGAPCELATS